MTSNYRKTLQDQADRKARDRALEARQLLNRYAGEWHLTAEEYTSGEASLGNWFRSERSLRTAGRWVRIVENIENDDAVEIYAFSGDLLTGQARLGAGLGIKVIEAAIKAAIAETTATN